MRARCILWLRRLLAWLDPPQGEIPRAALALIAHADTFAPGTSGEYKRAYVYGRLQKTFPGLPKRLLALTLETTLSGRPD